LLDSERFAVPEIKDFDRGTTTHSLHLPLAAFVACAPQGEAFYFLYKNIHKIAAFKGLKM
jgi:hypothetical protein